MTLRSSVGGLVAGILLSIPCLALAVSAAGGGHGTYFPAKLLFPFAMLSAAFHQSITAPYIVAAVLQFPIYGWILGSSRASSRFRTSLIVIAGLHLAALAFVVACSDQHYSESGKHELRGKSVRSADGKTYLIIDDNNGGGCGAIFFDRRAWPHPLHVAGEIQPGLHKIACGDPDFFIEFSLSRGAHFILTIGDLERPNPYQDPTVTLLPRLSKVLE